MDANTFKLKYKATVELVSQLRVWRTAAPANNDAIGGHEELLAYQLHLFGHFIDEAEPIPTKEDELVVYLGKRGASLNPKHRAQVEQLAIGWLAEPGPQQSAAFTFLSQFAPHDHDALLRCYQNHPAARIALFKLWRMHNILVPVELVRQAIFDPNNTSPELLRAALDYAADREDIPAEFFGGKYPSLTELAIALWAGMMRGDSQALDAIESLLKQADPAARSVLLQFAARSGDLRYLPVLRDEAAINPKQGLYWLALLGRKPAAEAILDALGDSRRLLLAADAWRTLTGQRLPPQPRLSVVGDSEQPLPSARHFDRVPDARAARAWWDAHHGKWRDTERYLAGQPITSTRLIELMRHATTKETDDLLALLALQLGKPLGVHPQALCARRLLRLKQLTAPVPHEPTVEVRHAH